MSDLMTENIFLRREIDDLRKELDRVKRAKRSTWVSAWATIEEVAEKTELSEERIRELCESDYFPHALYDGELRFKRQDVKTYIAENLIEVRGGLPMPKELNVLLETPENGVEPPESIRILEGLRPLPQVRRIPGVYFLCRGPAVVYVGMSTSVIRRVTTHWSEQNRVNRNGGAHSAKNFDRAYFIPVPESSLPGVERRFIELLQPEHNNQFTT